MTLVLLALVALAATLAGAHDYRNRRGLAWAIGRRLLSRRIPRITAARDEAQLTIAGGGRITAAADGGRELAGPLVRFGQLGKTSAGPLRVAAGALRFPDPLHDVKLTLEHDRGQSRGHLVAIDNVTGGLDARVRPGTGPEGDAAIREAIDHVRDGFSIDVENARVIGDTIVAADVVAIGQVGIPAFSGMRIDRIAASRADDNEGNNMNEAQRRRLAELRALETLTQAQALELNELSTLEAGDEAGDAGDAGTTPDAGTAGATTPPATTQRVAASMPATPAGAQRPPARTAAQGGALGEFVNRVVGLYRGSDASRSLPNVTAALADVTWTEHGDNVAAPAWSGELWSGVAYEPEFVPLLSSGPLTNWEGKGWRWVVKPEMADYAGDKTAIPSNEPTTEPSTYEAARMAVGHDIDRKFYDFPDAAFLASYLEACRESWAVKLDAKVEAYLIANAVAQPTITGGGSTLKAVGRLMRRLKRLRVGRGTFVVLNDNDYDDLMDLTNLDLPAFLELYNVDPKAFTSSASAVEGTVYVGAKMSNTVRTLPGSPIRATAQHLANGGIDEAFFGYWAIEEHHATGIVKASIA